MLGYETRISRRPEGWRELQEISSGSPSKAKDSCGSEGTTEVKPAGKKKS
jgi:hypothetical protein